LSRDGALLTSFNTNARYQNHLLHRRVGSAVDTKIAIATQATYSKQAFSAAKNVAADKLSGFKNG
jgi:hypothetical protein